jgi:hypothetical protein
MLEEAIERLAGYVWEEPHRLMSFAKGVAAIGAADLLAGAIGHVAVVGDAAIRHMSTSAGADHALVDIYPSLVTWWVPESLIGCVPAFLLVAAGTWLADFGRRLKQAY